MVPTALRSNLTLFITYALNDIDWTVIGEQIVRENTATFKNVIKYVFGEVDNFLIYRGTFS
jgi:phenylacetate-coenzyme A ligase PaaK-like adenylate-forming protein